jgi:predicted transcriptional regulator
MESDNAKSEDMPYRVYLLDAIHCGSEEIDHGEAIEHEEVRRRLAKWLEK